MGAQSLTDSQTAPKHVAIIMDGNGRWAQARGLPRAIGHKHGVENVKVVVEGSLNLGIKFLTLFGFSSENWKRTPTEIFDLMSLLRNYLDNEIHDLHKKNIRFKVIGDREKLDADIVRLIEAAEELTKANCDLTLIIALSYGGRRAIILAAKELAYRACKGTIKLDEISENDTDWSGSDKEAAQSEDDKKIEAKKHNTALSGPEIEVDDVFKRIAFSVGVKSI